ncbi:DNA repair protein XRCC3 [Nymphon striatum]|nr:DNA repair protein XRCC3 [Nymphon striatum]KAG1655797.1 DNA repair protein XRCC3 [Nymphon striatum]
MLKVKYTDHVTNKKIKELIGAENIQWAEDLAGRKLKFAGHVMRGCCDTLTQFVLEGLVEEKRDRGRQRKVWGDDLKEKNGLRARIWEKSRDRLSMTHASYFCISKIENGIQIIYLSVPEIMRCLKISKQDAVYLTKIVSKKYMLRPASTALEVLRGHCSNVFRVNMLSTGCDILNAMLDGGLSSVGITELVGESSCGKTQICLQLSLAAQLPKKFNGINSAVVYICTEDAFPTERLLEISQKFRNRYGDEIKDIKFGDNVFIYQVGDMDCLWNCIEKNLPNLLASKNVGLIIIDSVAALFRVEFDISQNIDRSRKIQQLGASLKRLISKYQVIICCVNQISANVSSDNSNIFKSANDSNVVPALGVTWSNIVSTRLFIKRTERQMQIGTKYSGVHKYPQPVYSAVREIKVCFSPYLPNRKSEFIVNAYGVQGIKS